MHIKTTKKFVFFISDQTVFVGLSLYNDWLLSCQLASAWSLLNEGKPVTFQVQQRGGGSPAHAPPLYPPSSSHQWIHLVDLWCYTVQSDAERRKTGYLDDILSVHLAEK